MTSNTPVAVVGFGAEIVSRGDGRSDAELLAPAVERALEGSGVDPAQVDVLCTAGSEFLGGVVGGIMGAFDAFPGWPPRSHSHLEGDGAFAFHEAWIRLLAGEGRTALVCAFSRPSAADPVSVLALQDDPYVVAPLGIQPATLAALQARALIDAGKWTEDDFARVVAARRPGIASRGHVLDRPYRSSPLRELDCSTVCAGAAAVVLAAGEAASSARRRPAWIRGVAQQLETQSLGSRDLTQSISTAALSTRLGIAGAGLDVLEVHAPYSHQELILVDAIAAAGRVALNPSGGALPADPIMATGLVRIGHAADAIMSGAATRAVGHATNGACLQHNLLCLMEAVEK